MLNRCLLLKLWQTWFWKSSDFWNFKGWNFFFKFRKIIPKILVGKFQKKARFRKGAYISRELIGCPKSFVMKCFSLMHNAHACSAICFAKVSKCGRLLFVSHKQSHPKYKQLNTLRDQNKNTHVVVCRR